MSNVCEQYANIKKKLRDEPLKFEFWSFSMIFFFKRTLLTSVSNLLALKKSSSASAGISKIRYVMPLFVSKVYISGYPLSSALWKSSMACKNREKLIC